MKCLGRHKRTLDRFCPHCREQTESVKHVIITCPLNTQTLQNLNDDSKLAYILNVYDVKAVNSISSLVSNKYIYIYEFLRNMTTADKT